MATNKAGLEHSPVTLQEAIKELQEISDFYENTGIAVYIDGEVTVSYTDASGSEWSAYWNL